MLYQSYRIGQWLSCHLPTPVTYRLAALLADLKYLLARADRRAIQRNLAAILGASDPRLPRAAREVFRNFSRYLVDFFRMARVNAAFVRRRVTIVGRAHLDDALAQGRGAILLTAHVGNYELGAVVAAALGYPISGIALTHRDPRIDALFKRQRMSCGVKVIPPGMALRQGFACLRGNGLLGVVGDRDFFNHGVTLTFLGRRTRLPKGAAVFSLRTGAPIIPVFLIREGDARYRFLFERPIEPKRGADEDPEVERLTAAGAAVLEQSIRRYPTQWYLFRDFDHPGPWVIL